MNEAKKQAEFLAWRVIDVCQDQHYPKAAKTVRGSMDNVKQHADHVRGELRTEVTRAGVAVVAAILVGLGWPA
jgi:hypothetical protein